MNTVSPSRITIVLGAVALTALASACSEPQQATSPKDQQFAVGAPSFTAGVGFGGPLLGRASTDQFKMKRKNGKWEFDLNAKDSTDVAIQSLTFQPGGNSGWHSHGGVVLLQVTSGTLTFYEGEGACTPETKTVGQLFTETGEHAHITRNEGSVPATALAIVFAPKGGALRVDEPASGNCPF